MTWIDEVMAQTAEVESPKSYVYWAALTTISAAVRNNVYLNKFYYKLYPNIFCFLIGPSGVKKGFPIKMAEDIIRLVGGIRVISGKASIQGITSSLATTQTFKDGSAPITDSAGFIPAPEFAASLVRDETALTMLTNLYDGHAHEVFDVTLKSGIEKMKRPNLVIIGGMNDPMFDDIITAREMTGGFIARSLLVLESERGYVNALTRAPKVPYEPEKLAPYVREVAKVKGEFKWTQAAMDFYEDWYYNKFKPTEANDKTGTVNRIHDTILKVTMLLSLSRRLSLNIELGDLTEAFQKVLILQHNAQQMTDQSGKSDLAPATKIVLKELMAAPEYKMTRTQLLQRHYNDFTSLELDQVCEHLVETKFLISPYRAGNKVWLELDKNFLERFKEAEKKIAGVIK